MFSEFFPFEIASLMFYHSTEIQKPCLFVLKITSATEMWVNCVYENDVKRFSALWEKITSSIDILRIRHLLFYKLLYFSIMTRLITARNDDFFHVVYWVMLYTLLMKRKSKCYGNIVLFQRYIFSYCWIVERKEYRFSLELYVLEFYNYLKVKMNFSWIFVMVWL